MGTSVSDSFMLTERPKVLVYKVNVCFTRSSCKGVITLVQALDFVDD